MTACAASPSSARWSRSCGWSRRSTSRACNLDSNGIHPRDADTLPDIAFAPFLHAGWGHLIGNTVPFLVLGADDRAQRPRPHRGGDRDRGARRRPRHVADRAGQHEPHRRQRPRVRLRRLPDLARDLQPQADPPRRRRRGDRRLRRDAALQPRPAPRHLVAGPPVRADRRRRRGARARPSGRRRREVRPRQRLAARAHLPRGRGGEGRPRPHHRGHALGGDGRRGLDRAHRRPGLLEVARGIAASSP